MKYASTARLSTFLILIETHVTIRRFGLDIEFYICRLFAMQKRKCSKQTIALLSVLLAQPGKWCHGYELSKETGLKSGTLYPILMRLCDRGLLESGWQESPDPGRPPRHIYRLTRTGLAFAREHVSMSELAGARHGMREAGA